MKTIRYVVSGRVQGVGFRYFVWQHAEIMGLDGWVFNRADGTVEAVIRGTESQHLQIRARLEEGPRFAIVESIVEGDTSDSVSASGFEIRRDGR